MLTDHVKLIDGRNGEHRTDGKQSASNYGTQFLKLQLGIYC